MLKRFLALLAAVACTAQPVSAQFWGYPAPAPTLPPNVILGAYVNPDGISRTDSATMENETRTLEAGFSPARRLGSDLHFYPFKSITVSKLALDQTIQGDLTYGRLPVISWRCGAPLADIASGVYDSPTIINAAKALKSLGKPVMIRFMWEFNLNTNGQTTNSQAANCFDQTQTTAQKGATYIAAWEHIYTVFHNNGATTDAGGKVYFEWCPAGGVGNLNTVDLSLFLPPKAYIDWLGFDAYDQAGANTFQATMDQAYQKIDGFGYALPIAFTETGEFQGNVGAFSQQQFLTDAESLLPSTYPDIHMFMYFDAQGTVHTWTFNSLGLTQFLTIGADPYFAATLH